MGTDTLDELLVAASEAPPDQRIRFRDPIAVHGAAAIERLTERVWIGDRKYAAFAIRTIAKVGQLGARSEAIGALREAEAVVKGEALQRDIVAALAALGADRLVRPRGSGRGSSDPQSGIGELDELVEGHCYRRRDLHLSGLGGNRQRGISYPASGAYCLLFSDPSKESEYGYRDAPVGENGYRYFGEWNGTGDMMLAGGNKAILDRSPDLHLFVRARDQHVYRGRYECVDWGWESTVRDGRQLRAIVFELRRTPAR